MRSINWRLVKFDVLCIETEPSNRPPFYAENVTSFLLEKGYKNNTMQQGRNICKKSLLLFHSTAVCISLPPKKLKITVNVVFLLLKLKIGFIRNDFVPFERPGFVDPQCYNGQKKGDHADRFWLTRGRIGPFKRCATTSLY